MNEAMKLRRLLRVLGPVCIAASLCGTAALAQSTEVTVLRASLAAAERAAADARAQLLDERAAGRLSDRALEDFAAWVERLDEDVRRQREQLAWLEARDAGTVVGGAPASGEDPFRYDAAPTRGERTTSLDSTLDSSLGEFDDMLLREQRLLSERPQRSETDAGGGAGGEDGQEQSSGASGASSGSWAEGGGAERGSEQAAARSAAAGGGSAEIESEAEQGAAGGAGTASAEATGAGTVATATGAGEDRGAGAVRGAPPDIPDGRDDDIVARQIREAAERESDPELRRKLWDEYRRYKNASR